MQANTSTTVEQAGLADARRYALKSDLAQFCLPAAARDANRKLAYVNSICLFFLIVGIVGMRNPVEFKKELPPLLEFMPVEIYVPPVQQQTLPEPKPDEPPPPDTVVEMPQIATVVAAEPSQVKFAVSRGRAGDFCAGAVCAVAAAGPAEDNKHAGPFKDLPGRTGGPMGTLAIRGKRSRRSCKAR